jgi:hypothetical protein
MSEIRSSRRRTSSALLLVALGTGASSAAATEPAPRTKAFTVGETLPEGYRTERATESYWTVPAATLLSVSYFVSVSGVAASDFRGPYASLAIPVAGPFIALALRPTACEREARASQFWCTFSFDEEDRNMTLALLLDGVTQVVSGTMLALSLNTPKFVFRRPGFANVRVVPMRMGSGHGLSVQGAF